jgi:flavin reductase (DIM6/NTAB) family NADH-FMN oxidoreductase RutF
MLDRGMCASTASSAPAQVSAAEFRQAGRRFASGVTVATTRLGSVVHGATVSAFATLSLEPLQVLISLASTGRLAGLIHASGVFAVNILAEHQQPVARAFASPARTVSECTFPDVESRGVATGAPILEGCLAFFDCTIEAAFESGDHTIFSGNVKAVGDIVGLPLVYFDGAYRALQLSEP